MTESWFSSDAGSAEGIGDSGVSKLDGFKGGARSRRRRSKGKKSRAKRRGGAEASPTPKTAEQKLTEIKEHLEKIMKIYNDSPVSE